MDEPVKDSTLTNTNARLTSDKGLGIEKYLREKIDYIYDKNGRVVGVQCSRFGELSEAVLKLDRPESKSAYKLELERQYHVLLTGMITLRYTSSSCLLKAAGSLHQLLLLLLALPDEKKIPVLAEALLDIFAEVEKRTRKPYQFQIVFNDENLFKPLHPGILTEFPLSQHVMWKQIVQRKKTLAAPKGKVPEKNEGLIPIIEKEEAPVNQKELDNAIEAAAANIKITAELASIPLDDTPLVTQYRANLTKLTLEDVYKQTQFRLKTGDWKLADLVEVIYYVSAMTIVLDKNGEPVEKDGIYGLFSYGMILSSRKFKTIKFVPPPGKYVSLGPLAGQQFQFEGGIIKKLPIQYNGILGYQEVDVTGQWAPDYQVQANEVLGRNKVYMGSLVTKNAFGSKDIGITDMAAALPEIVEVTMPYFFKVIEKKIKSWFQNYEEILKELATEVLKNLIIDALKRIAIRYIVKKIGKRVIPVVNVISAIKDTVDTIRGIDNERDTIAINCVRLYLKAVNLDDKTLSVKILANIMGDEFENDIKSAIINHASKAVKKVAGSVSKSVKKPVEHLKPVEESGSQPATETVKPEAQTPGLQKPKATDPNVIEEGWKAFHKTRKEQEETAEKERGTDNKANTRPQEEESGKDTTLKPVKSEEEDKSGDTTATANKGHEDDAKKKAQAARLALIKERQQMLDKAKADEKAKEARKTKDKKIDDKKTGTTITDPKKAADELAKKGKKSRMNAVRRKARAEAIKDAWESLKSGNPTPQALHLANRLESKYGREAKNKFMETGELPKGVEFSHLFSASEYPEFSHRGDLGVLTDEEEHRQGHHGGNTRDPLHGSPKIPGEDDNDDNDE